MSRIPRIDVPGLAQHVVLRGHNREAIFRTDLDRRVFMKYLKEALSKQPCDLHAYVLMTNHLHLLVTGHERTAISALMQSVGRRYSRYVNRTLARTGSLFERRFYSSLVQTEAYFLACMRYIELNPVRAGMATTPGAYPWSSHGDNLTGSPHGLLRPHPEFMRLGSDEAARARAYRALFELQLDPALISQFRRGNEKCEAVGSHDFKTRLESVVGHRVTVSRPGPRGTRGPEI